MKTLTLLLTAALLSFGCTSPDAPEATPGQERMLAFREALVWDIDLAKLDLERAREAIDERPGDDLVLSSRWQLLRKDVEAVDTKVTELDSIDRAELDGLLRDVARVRDGATQLLADLEGPLEAPPR